MFLFEADFWIGLTASLIGFTIGGLIGYKFKIGRKTATRMIELKRNDISKFVWLFVLLAIGGFTLSAIVGGTIAAIWQNEIITARVVQRIAWGIYMGIILVHLAVGENTSKKDKDIEL